LGEISVTVDGAALQFDVSPQIIDGRTMVPLRVVFEALDAEVNWLSDTQTITATRNHVTVAMQVGHAVISVNGYDVELEVAPLIINGRTLVPFRAVAESFGVDVDWDDITQTVIITQ